MSGGAALSRIFASFVAATLIVVTVACGGNASTPRGATTISPSPTPTNPAPTPPPTPPPTPTPSPSSTQFQSTLFAGTTAHGQVTVDTAATVTIQLAGATVNTQYGVEFCPFPSTRYQCFPVGMITTDGTGAAQTTMHFPTSGVWSGDFDLTSSGVVFSTQIGSNAGQVFLATLEPANIANGQGTGSTATSSATPQDKGSGTVTVNGGTVHVALTGATANAQYAVIQCFPSAGSGCFQLGPFNGNTFTTDNSGNGSFDVAASDIPGDFFTVEQATATPSTPMGLSAGFKVP